MTDAQPPHSAGQPQGTAQTSRGGCGCLFVLLVILLSPMLLLGGIWLLLPTLVSGSDTDWQMVAPDPERVAAVEERLTSAMERGTGDGLEIELSELEINQMLSHGIQAGIDQARAEEESDYALPATLEELRARVRLEPGSALTDVQLPLSARMPMIPGRLDGATLALHLAVELEAADTQLLARVDSARIGRIPLPANTALGLLARFAPEVVEDWVAADGRTLRLPVMSPARDGSRLSLHGLDISDDTLRLQLREAATH